MSRQNPGHVDVLAFVDLINAPGCQVRGKPNQERQACQQNPRNDTTHGESLKLIRSRSITRGRLVTFVWIEPMYSPMTPIKNNCTEESRKSPTTTGAMPALNSFQNSNL